MKAGAASYSRGTHRPRVAEDQDLAAPLDGAAAETRQASSPTMLFDRVDSDEEEENLIVELELLVRKIFHTNKS